MLGWAALARHSQAGVGTFTPLPTAAMCSMGLVHTHLCALAIPCAKLLPGPEPAVSIVCSETAAQMSLRCGPDICPACGTDAAPRQVLDDLQQTPGSQGKPDCQGKDYAQWEEMGFDLSGCCLHAVPAGGCQLGQDLGPAAG